MLQVGDQAPDFTLKTTSGDTFRLADQRGRRSIVLYFYPKTTRRAARPKPARFATSTRTSWSWAPKWWA
ncbi:redoxin domain-containing protein [Hymenobacter cellulosilyticus]|uniref:redoxin domain-containing protein n=1 Tax=Hymenobacter cellulosilyticus TaxID=2932248 RepID=UPI00288029B6|nr:redoxin domain-containing protein [Hymenobacter cellulosilyticus]